MSLENRIRSHYESKVADAEPAAIADVLSRGHRLRRRARAGAAFLSVVGVASVTLITFLLIGDRDLQPDTATLLSTESLADQIVESWSPVPDPVDPALAAQAGDICPFDQRALDRSPEPVTPLGPPELWVIDQRGVSATVVHGVETATGHVATSCSVVKVDGEWRNAIGLVDDAPGFAQGSGGPVSEFVGEIRLRFPDGTEVVASLGNGHYVVTYPGSLRETLAEPGSVIYMESYTDDGILITSEPYMSHDDYLEIQDLEG